MSTRVIVTRPLREAQGWVRELAAAGLKVVALPLIEIRPVDDAAPLQQAWQRLADYVGVMFVSANAVDGFFTAKPACAISFVQVMLSKQEHGPPVPVPLRRWREPAWCRNASMRRLRMRPSSIRKPCGSGWVPRSNRSSVC